MLQVVGVPPTRPRPWAALPLLLLLRLAVAGGVATQRVLFVGNSYTFVNDLPHTYQSLAESRLPGLQVTVDSDATGARSLGEASRVGSCRAKVQAGGYDFLVLHDQSCVPGIPDDFFPQ